MTRKTVMGIHAPPPRPTWFVCSVFLAGGLICLCLLGLALDPVLRWLLGLR